MASRYRWRQQLLGSLQGQLQLATYLVVFLGFTGASSVGLLIGQRNLLANDQQLARQSIALCDKAIRGLQDDPARLEQELLFHSDANTSLWIEDNSGTLLPGVMTMSIAPSVASIRSNNFAAAEAQAVAYSAVANVSHKLPKVPDNCDVGGRYVIPAYAHLYN